MKSFNALPTEQRVKDMNDRQWFWCYLNLIEEETQTIERQEQQIEYLTYFINYDMAKAVSEQKGSNKEETADAINDSFENEIKQFLQDGEQFVELPGSNYKTSTESKDEFIQRAKLMQDLYMQNPEADIFQEVNPISNKKRSKSVSRDFINRKNEFYEIDNEEFAKEEDINRPIERKGRFVNPKKQNNSAINKENVLNKENKFNNSFSKEEFEQNLKQDLNDDDLDIFIVPDETE